MAEGLLTEVLPTEAPLQSLMAEGLPTEALPTGAQLRSLMAEGLLTEALPTEAQVRSGASPMRNTLPALQNRDSRFQPTSYFPSRFPKNLSL